MYTAYILRVAIKIGTKKNIIFSSIYCYYSSTSHSFFGKDRSSFITILQKGPFFFIEHIVVKALNYLLKVEVKVAIW